MGGFTFYAGDLSLIRYSYWACFFHKDDVGCHLSERNSKVVPVGVGYLPLNAPPKIQFVAAV